MNISSVGVTGFVNDRKFDIDFLKAVHKSQNNESEPKSTSRKRNIDRLRYRTKSFQSYKCRKCNIKQRSPLKKPSRRTRRYKSYSNSTLNLKSHLWHVKRLFMGKQVNYSIPSHNKKFGYKAVERFSSQRCVMMDQSYYKNLTIRGTNLLQIMSEFMDTRSLFFTLSDQKHFKKELGEIQVAFHRRHKHPSQCIGVVYISFIDDLSEEGLNSIDQLSLWMHPLVYDEILQELLTIEQEIQNEDLPSLDQVFQVTSCDHLSRVALRGPKSLNVLLSLVDYVEKYLPRLTGNNANKHNDDSEVGSDYLRQLLEYKHLNRIWRPRQTLSVDLRRPIKTDPSAAASGNVSSLKWPSKIGRSTLWNKDNNQGTTLGVFRTKSNSIKSKWIKSQANNHSSSSSKEQSVITSAPLVLIRKTTSYIDSRNRKSELSGWDIILSKAHLSVVWQCLLFAGAIAVGSDEWDHLHKGVGELSFPRDYIDTQAGRRYWMSKRSFVERCHSLTPFRHRRNEGDIVTLLSHVKDGVKNHSTTSKQPSEKLTEIPESLVIVRGSHYSADFGPPPFEVEAFNARTLTPVTPLPTLPPLMLINVSVAMTSRGLPLDLAQLLMPTETDYASWLNGCSLRQNRRQTVGTSKEPAMWTGHKLKKYSQVLSGYEGRSTIGFVTSGQKPHINNTSVVIGVVSANNLNKLFLDSFGKYAHPQAHMLVLVKNVRSQWLRPALISIL